jgi:hypothetical protein
MLKKVEYTEIDTLQKIVNAMDEENDPIHNLILTCSISVTNLKNNSMLDVCSEAEKWMERKCPNDLHINHGEYVKDGMAHIIQELTTKPSSNRALYSLISQKDISSSGDKPIPSFMIFQTKIVGSDLYVSVYFRALETSRFLPINLEEIRLRLVEITDKLSIVANVKLCFFAFYAYKDPTIQPLTRPEIESLSVSSITRIINTEPQKLNELLLEKSKNSTVIELDSIYNIREIFNDNTPERLKSGKENIIALLDDCISKGGKLKTSRERNSHHHKLAEESKDFTDSLVVLSERLNNDS